MAVLLPCGCEPWQTTDPAEPDLRPALFAVPDDLSFEASVNEEGEQTRSFQLVNRLDHTVLVWGYTDVDGDPVFAAGDGMAMLAEVPAGGVIEVPVRFTPDADADYGAVIRVQTDAAEVPAVEVSLAGLGLAPSLTSELSDEPTLPVGCDGALELEIGNAGGDDLHIHDTVAHELGDFALLGPIPSRLAPSQRVTVPIAFRPAAEGARSGSIALFTDDPVHPSVEIALHGTGTAADRRVESFHYGAGGGVDLLLAVEDASGGAWVSSFATGLGDLLDGLDARGVDWRVAAVSTETGCAASPDAWGSPADERSLVLEQLRETLLDGDGVPDDALLRLLRQATESTGPEGCLSAFRRSGRPLHAILIAEDDDASPGGWAAEVQRAQAAIDAPLVISALVPGQRCVASAPTLEAAVAHTGGALLDLCATDWASQWDALAQTSATFESGAVAFELAEPPLPGTVHVLVAGDPWTAFTVDAANRRVTFTAAPEDGSEVRIGYASAGACP